MRSRGKPRSRRRFTRDDRQRLVSAWRRSGLSQTRFAREHGLDASYLSRWKTEFPDERADLVAVDVVEGLQPTLPTAASPFCLRLPSGIEVEVAPDFDSSALARLIVALDRARC